MTETTILKFLLAAPEDRLRMARNDENATMLKEYFGQAAFEEYRKIAGRLDEAHLSSKATKNVIFVPGVMGSYLESKGKSGIWWIDVRTRDHINDLRLSPDGREDADPDNEIAPCSTDPSYEPFMTAVLTRDDFGHVLFPYDWRKPLNLSTSAFKDSVLKLHETNGNREIHIVAHSMGGLLVRAALMAHGRELWPKLGRIVFVGTPHYGSPAIAGYLKNHLWGFDLMAVLGLYLDRDTFRSLWGVLCMMPAPRGVYPGTRPAEATPWTSDNPKDPYVHPCTNFDMYRAESWKLDLTAEQTSQLQNALSAAARFHSQLFQAHNELNQDLRDRMLVIAGVGNKTLFRLAYDSGFLGIWEHTDKVTDRIEGDMHREGDGRVPLASAALDNVPIRFVKGIHGGLTNIPEVYNDVFRWLNQENLQLPDTVEGALSQHLGPEAGESEAPHLDGTALRKKDSNDDPGYWNLSPPDQAQLTVLDAKLANKDLPEFITVRLF